MKLKPGVKVIVSNFLEVNKEHVSIIGTILTKNKNSCVVKLHDSHTFNMRKIGNGILEVPNKYLIPYSEEIIPTVNKNYIKETYYIQEQFVADYNNTWIDRFYNAYCKLLGRNKREIVAGKVFETEVQNINQNKLTYETN